MKAAPLLIQWHNSQTPVYSAHFQPHGKGRLATGGGDNNVRLWKFESQGSDRSVSYLSTLAKHSQAVNVVRWCPLKEDVLASAGDDGNVLIWVPAERPEPAPFGASADFPENKETWRVKHMCRSTGAEIYDLAWSPDGLFFITGSMDNIVRIWNGHDGTMVRQIADHSHYVQGVAWDPLNEYVATQSSDRSVHVYSLKTKDGHFNLTQHNKVSKMDLPARSYPAHSPAPGEPGPAAPPAFQPNQPAAPPPKRAPLQPLSVLSDREASVAGSVYSSVSGMSPVLPTPGTPGTTATNMPCPPAFPPPPPPPGQVAPSVAGSVPAHAHSRRSSHSSMKRSVSPAPSFPLPAVMPSPSPSAPPTWVRNTHIYANETYTSFFRRLTFSPDGSLLFTPAGQYKTVHLQNQPDGTRGPDEIINTVYIYTRAGLNRPPIAYLPGHTKASIAVRCSPTIYSLRTAPPGPTRNITIDTSSTAEPEIPPLPDALATPKESTPISVIQPPYSNAPSPRTVEREASTAESTEPAGGASAPAAQPARPPVFALPYRVVYAVAAHDTVYVYDTQHRKPLCVVSNLHYSAFTDLAWAPDGHTLLISSSDGFCSALSFSADDLGMPYLGPVPPPAPNRSGPAIQSINLPPFSAPPMSVSSSSGGQTTLTPLLSAAPAGQPSRHSRHSTPSGGSAANSVVGGSASEGTASSSNWTVHSMPVSMGGVNSGGGGVSSTVVLPPSATPTIGFLPSVAATHSGSPPATPRGRSIGAMGVPGSRHRAGSASSSASVLDLSSLPAPPLFQRSTESAASSVVGGGNNNPGLSALTPLTADTISKLPPAPSSSGSEILLRGQRKRSSEAVNVNHFERAASVETPSQAGSVPPSGTAKKRRVGLTPVPRPAGSEDEKRTGTQGQ